MRMKPFFSSVTLPSYAETYVSVRLEIQRLLDAVDEEYLRERLLPMYRDGRLHTP